MFSNKKFLLKKLYDYPEINNDDYLLLINRKKNILKDANYINEELLEINTKIDLYNEKLLIINMIKNPLLWSYFYLTYNSNP